jgi:ATP-dependent exoDNAse (exonuclease V) beta subunit
VWRDVEPIQQEFAPAPVCLDWLTGIEPAAEPVEIGSLAGSLAGRLRSATELDLERRDPEAWRLQYVHGVLSPSRFAEHPNRPRADGGEDRTEDSLPGRVRGLVVHGVLEQSDADDDLDELDRLLEQALGGLGDEESGLVVGSADAGSRERLREEIRRVLASEAWREWVAGEHHRELSFVHLAGPGDWRQGRIDLFVPPRDPDDPERADVRIVDFKTDRVEQSGLEAAAGRYRTQSTVYREAIEAILGARDGMLPGGGRVRVLLHFTHANRQVEV